jgi:hypothetical protein
MQYALSRLAWPSVIYPLAGLAARRAISVP